VSSWLRKVKGLCADSSYPIAYDGLLERLPQYFRQRVMPFQTRSTHFFKQLLWVPERRECDVTCTKHTVQQGSKAFFFYCSTVDSSSAGPHKQVAYSAEILLAAALCNTTSVHRDFILRNALATRHLTSAVMLYHDSPAWWSPLPQLNCIMLTTQVLFFLIVFLLVKYFWALPRLPSCPHARIWGKLS